MRRFGCTASLLYELLESPGGKIAGVGWRTLPRIGLHRESAPCIESCTHLGWIEREHIIADIYAVRNPNHLERVAKYLCPEVRPCQRCLHGLLHHHTDRCRSDWAKGPDEGRWRLRHFAVVDQEKIARAV